MKRLLTKAHVAVLVAASLGIAVGCGCSKSPPSALSAPAISTKMVTGTVVGPDGAPVPGATVVVETGSSPDNLVTLEADENGQFAIELQARAHWPDHFGRACVHKPGLAVGGCRLSDGGNVVQLGVGSEIVGKAVDQFGRPVADATVVPLSAERSYLIFGPIRDKLAAHTAEDGVWRICDVPANRRIRVMLDDPSGEWVAAAHEEVSVTESLTTGAPDLILTRGAIIEGTVTDMTTGEPLPGVCVGSYGPHRPMSSTAIISDYTDEHGRYQLRVAPGQSTIYVAGAPPGYQEGKAATVDLGRGESAVADFAVGPPWAGPGRNKGWWPF